METMTLSSIKMTTESNVQARSSGLSGELARYVVAGGLAALLNMSLYTICWRLLVSLGVVGDYLLADVVGFLGGTTLSYQLSIRWIFPRRRLANRTLEYGAFSSIGAIGLLLSQLSLWLLIGWLGLHRDLAKLIAVAVVLLWNFGARKLILFR